MVDNDAERAAIKAATNRLIDGSPERSTGALTILQLAAEAGIKRWVLTHKHTDLAEEFRQRTRSNHGKPTAAKPLEKRAATAEAANKALRLENAQLRQQIKIYAQVIHELTIERTRIVTPTTLHALPRVSENS